jgi:hypothetical protein
MPLHMLLVLAVVLTWGQQAKADVMYGYSLGVSLQNTIVPGSSVSIDAFLLNSGSLPIVFAHGFSSGSPSAQGGSVPFGVLNSDGQWSILDNGFSSDGFFEQFAGVTVGPGQTFQYRVGTFEAPINQPLGTSATPGINFGIKFTDNIVGNLLAICPGACDYDNAPSPSFTLGNTPFKSDITFFQGVVVDSANPTPEPAAWRLLGTVIVIAGLSRITLPIQVRLSASLERHRSG